MTRTKHTNARRAERAKGQRKNRRQNQTQQGGGHETHRRRYDLFLNEYTDQAFTKCPRCDVKTKVRKYPLVIHVEPRQLLCLNKFCRFCTECELLIVKQHEMESLMVTALKPRHPHLIGNDYLVCGTIDKEDWRQREALMDCDMFDRTWIFKDSVKFTVIPAGWHADDRDSD